MAKFCRHCASYDLEFKGYADGGGDYGDSVVEEWYCNGCDQYLEGSAVFDDADFEDSEPTSNEDAPDDYDYSAVWGEPDTDWHDDAPPSPSFTDEIGATVYLPPPAETADDDDVNGIPF